MYLLVHSYCIVMTKCRLEVTCFYRHVMVYYYADVYTFTSRCCENVWIMHNCVMWIALLGKFLSCKIYMLYTLYSSILSFLQTIYTLCHVNAYFILIISRKAILYFIKLWDGKFFMETFILMKYFCNVTYPQNLGWEKTQCNQISFFCFTDTRKHLQRLRQPQRKLMRLWETWLPPCQRK